MLKITPRDYPIGDLNRRAVPNPQCADRESLRKQRLKAFEPYFDDGYVLDDPRGRSKEGKSNAKNRET